MCSFTHEQLVSRDPGFSASWFILNAVLNLCMCCKFNMLLEDSVRQARFISTFASFTNFVDR